MVIKKTPGMEFHLFIDDYIKASGKSISKIARDTHIPADSLRKYASGKVMINIQYLFVLADYFDVPVWYLIQYKHRNKFFAKNSNIEFYIM